MLPHPAAPGSDPAKRAPEATPPPEESRSGPDPLPADGSLPRVGETLGGCRLLERVGRGGMGIVFKAHHLKLDRVVAVKVLTPSPEQEKEDVERFLREARSLARLEHPNIVGVHHVDQEGGRNYLVMSYVEGESLAARLERGRLEPREAARVAAGVARGLAAAHAKGIIHRDLKPQNILLTPAGVPTLVDFGIARRWSGEGKITQKGTVIGSPAYMAPEQCRGRDEDPRADLYSLGVTLYEALTGKPPFGGKSSFEIMEHQVRSPAPDPREKAPDVPAPLASIVLRLLEKDPQRRYPDASAVAEDLERGGSRSGGLRGRGRVVGFALLAAAAAVGIALALSRERFLRFWVPWRQPEISGPFLSGELFFLPFSLCGSFRISGPLPG